MAKLACWQCQADLDSVPLPVSRHATCDGCGYEIHCCRQCTHFAPSAPGNCNEDRAEVPNNKEVANFCEYFSPTTPAGAATSADKSAAAKAQLDALFGDSSEDNT